jgi:hypothetical protein
MFKQFEKISVADPDPGSGIYIKNYLAPYGYLKVPKHKIFSSVFCNVVDPDPGLVTNFWVKSSIVLWNLAQILFEHLKTKIIFNFVKFVATKKVWQLIFF